MKIGTPTFNTDNDGLDKRFNSSKASLKAAKERLLTQGKIVESYQ